MRPHSTAMLVSAVLVFHGSTVAESADVPVAFRAAERDGGPPVACRVHLKDANGKSVKAAGLPFWQDHFSCPGTAELALAPGEYTYEVERGPEYRRIDRPFTAKGGAPVNVNVRLERLTDLAKEGWWAGDLHIHRPVEDIELLAEAEDLHIAPVITWWSSRKNWKDAPLPDPPLRRFNSRFSFLLAGEDERNGGALLYFHLTKPLPVLDATKEYPSPLAFVAQARAQMGAWIDIEKPFWWDVPTWVASGQVDSIGLANNHMCRERMYESEAWGHPRPVERLPAPRGNGYWSQEIYYQLLNCGIRLPPSAGSASGVLWNPVGYNRVYVQTGLELKYDDWWEGLRAGRSFVTNGPLLRVKANGKHPGHVFTAGAGETLQIDLAADLASRDPIHEIEIVQNGAVVRLVSFDEQQRTVRLGSLTFTGSGWFLVRTIADNPRTFRFASTAPFYVEIGDQKRRVSKASAKFFAEWVRERVGRISLDDPDQRRDVLAPHERAQKFWDELAAGANAE